MNAPAMTASRLGTLLANAQRPADLPGAAAGTTVEVEDVLTGRVRTFRLVDPHLANPAEGLLSLTSPVGAALEGRHAGELVTAATPRGDRALRIVSVRR